MDKFTARLRCGSISVAVITHPGAREYQEDSYGFSELKPDMERFAAVLADGMGGLSSGALVSAQTVSGMLSEPLDGTDIPGALVRAAQRTSSDIAAGGTGGGSTMAEAVVTPEGLYFCSVGDSRIYLRRGNILTRLTEDQDHFQTLLAHVADGSISYRQAVSDKDRDALTQYMGSGTALSPDRLLRAFPLLPGDRIMLCSDGVYNALTAAELLQSLMLSAGGAAEDILGRILTRGRANQDNFTAIVLEALPDYSPEPLPQPPESSVLSAEHSMYTSAGGGSGNGDSVYAGGGIYAAADGLGGRGNGAKASAQAVKFLSEHRNADFSPEGIQELFIGADSAVRELGGLAAIAAGFVQDGRFTFGNVGDSRVYYFRGGRITARTLCHPEQIRGSENRAQLLKALGSSDAPEIQQGCGPIEIHPGDAFLVCTDGFWEHVHERDMEADLLKSQNSSEWLGHMLKRHIQAAHENGDNYSAVCGIFTNEPVPPKRKRRRILPAVIAAVSAALMILALAAVLMWLSGDSGTPDEPPAQTREI